MRPSCQPPTSAAPTSNPQMFPNQFWKKLKVDLKVREKHFPILPAIGKPKFNLHFCTLNGVTFYSSSKRTSFTRKDSTAIGQTASLAAVALLLNTNNPSTTTPDPELAGGPERYSERIRSYRNSVAYIDAEVETLISRQRRGSKFVLPRLVNLIIQLF